MKRKCEDLRGNGLLNGDAILYSYEGNIREGAIITITNETIIVRDNEVGETKVLSRRLCKNNHILKNE